MSDMSDIPRPAASRPLAAQARLAALLVSAALALTACESLGLSRSSSAGTPSGEQGEVVDVISAGLAPAGQVTPSDGVQADPGAESADAEPFSPLIDTLAARVPEPSINDDPQQLIGMGPASLNAFLGAPELIRREAPASLWQYRADNCVLDVVLYTDRSGDRVTYLEAREDGATKMPPRTCLNKLLRARLGDSAG